MTGLDFRVVPVAFTQGQDTLTNPKLVVPGKWQQLINMSLAKDNTPRRRDGSQALIAGLAANGLATHGNEMLAISGSNASAFSSSTGAMVAKSGKVGGVSVARESVRHSSGSIDSPDCASNGTVTLYAWRDKTSAGVVNGVNVTLIDEKTGVKMLDALSVRADANVISPRVVWDGSAFFLFYITSSGGPHLYCRIILADGTVGAETAMQSSISLAVANFDACKFTATGGVVGSVLVVYRWNDGVTSVFGSAISRTGTTPSDTHDTPLVVVGDIPTANVRGVCCGTFGNGSAGIFIVNDSGTPGMWSIALSTAYATLATGGTFVAQFAAEAHITCTRTSSGGDCLRVFWDQFCVGTSTLRPLRHQVVDTLMSPISGGTVVNTAGTSHVFGAGAANGPEGPFIAGKAFTAADGTTTYLPVFTFEGAAFGTVLQNAFFLIEVAGAPGDLFTSPPVVARALYGSYGFAANANPVVATPCSTPSIGSSFALGAPEVTSLSLENGIAITQQGLAKLTLTPNTSLPLPRAEIGPVTYLGGGHLVMYDGSRVVEAGFPLFPENIGLVDAAGGACTNGLHQVVAVYEWIDNQGQRHQSSPSPASSFTLTGGTGHKIRTTVPTLRLSQRPKLTIVLYMTTAAGTVFFRVGSPLTDTPNDVTVSFVTIDIDASDASLQTQEALYTQPDQGGSTLPNDAPPPCKALCASQKRLWLLSADNALEYRYSQELLSGFGLQFNGLFGDTTLGGLVPSESGGTVTVAPLDEKTIIFCMQKLYVIFGGMPDASGDNNTLSEPDEIPSPAGCSDAQSVLRMPQGLMFKAMSGWHLLGRDLSVSYIGEGVANFDTYRIVSSTLMLDRQECRFEAQFANGSTDGVTLVYAYLTGQWSVFYRGSNLLHPIAATDALWYAPLSQYVWLCPTGATPSGGLFADVPDVWDDFVGTASRSPVFTSGVTAWLHLASLNGFQRVRRLYLSGTPVSRNTINTQFQLTVDFDDSGAAPGAYATNPLPITSMPAAGVVDVRHKLVRQKCKSVRFTFLEAPATTGQLPLLGWQTMAMEIGFRRGVNKLPSAQTI